MLLSAVAGSRTHLDHHLVFVLLLQGLLPKMMVLLDICSKAANGRGDRCDGRRSTDAAL
jgi:hypothetical protein